MTIDVFAHFADLELSYQWIDMLKLIEELETEVNAKHDEFGKRVIYQVLNLPWPVANRDLVLERTWDIDSQNKTVTAVYHSIDDNRRPMTKTNVRAWSPHTAWRFEHIDPLSIGDERNSYAFLGTKSKKFVESKKTNSGEACPSKSGRTFISLESVVDVKGSLPSWLVNYMQKTWPSKALNAFHTLASSGQKPPHPQLINW